MRAILWVVALALLMLVVWGLWRRTARQSLTVLFLTIGTILVVGGGAPLVWWQTHLPKAEDRPLQIRDHRLISQTQIQERDFLRLEITIEVLLPSLSRERLRAIAEEYLREAIVSHKPDLVAVRLEGFGRPLLYEYAYRPSVPSARIQPWLQPAAAEIAAGAHLEEPMGGELEGYRTIMIFVTMAAKWAHLQSLLGEGQLPSAWVSLDESLYDYVVVVEDKQPRMVVLFALLNEEFLQQYQLARGRLEELGLLQGEIPMPSLLVLSYAMHESLFRVSDIAIVQRRGETWQRYEPTELTLREHTVTRPPWLALVGNFPSFPNVLAQVRAGSYIIGLMRFPDWLDPSQGFQVYYGDRIATFGRKP